LRLPAALTSPGQARSFVAAVCAAEGLSGETAEMAELMTSELVTNSVLRAEGSVDLELSVTTETVTAEVTDHGRHLPQLLEAPLGAEGGRGLAMVATIAASWGVDVHPDGKTVWFELPRQPDFD
jgi:anti-sigma regulatory factor (Ser/Thr protein kinase)